MHARACPPAPPAPPASPAPPARPQFLGLVISLLGGVGFFACGREHLPLRTLLLVGLGFSVLATMGLMDQVRAVPICVHRYGPKLQAPVSPGPAR